MLASSIVVRRRRGVSVVGRLGRDESVVGRDKSAVGRGESVLGRDMLMLERGTSIVERNRSAVVWVVASTGVMVASTTATEVVSMEMGASSMGRGVKSIVTRGVVSIMTIAVVSSITERGVISITTREIVSIAPSSVESAVERARAASSAVVVVGAASIGEIDLSRGATSTTVDTGASTIGVSSIGEGGRSRESDTITGSSIVRVCCVAVGELVVVVVVVEPLPVLTLVAVEARDIAVAELGERVSPPSSLSSLVLEITMSTRTPSLSGVGTGLAACFLAKNSANPPFFAAGFSVSTSYNNILTRCIKIRVAKKRKENKKRTGS